MWGFIRSYLLLYRFSIISVAWLLFSDVKDIPDIEASAGPLRKFLE